MNLKKNKTMKKGAKKPSKQKKKKNMAEVTTDDFFNQDFENLDGSDDSDEEVKKEKVILDKSSKKSKDPSKKNGKTAPNTNSKEYNNKLLDFNVEDDEVDEDLESMLSDDDNLRHIPDGELEVASDDSDYEPDVPEKRDTGDRIKVTLKLIKSWQEEIQKEKSAKIIKCVVEAFNAAVLSISDVEDYSTKYIVEGGAIFNSIIQVCIMFLPEAFKRFLNIVNDTRFEAHKAKRFPKIKGVLKSYLSDVIAVLESVSSSDIIETLLKHLHQMIHFTHSFSSLRKPLLRILLKYWSTAEEETVRVLAFLCIVKIATKNSAILNGLLKTMYIKYIENSKFVSPNTLPGINFMRRSLSELYLLDNEHGYNNAFLYLRQLAIHLRNALTLKKKEHFQAVYNWQYINSLWFWAELIPRARKQSQMWSLLYPLVQITLGVANLIPTSQYYPLRFHCIRMLISISRETGVFVPSLPLIIGILEDYDFNKKHKIVSMKPMSLMCLLRVSKSQASENGYKDALIENIYELLLESAAKDSHYVFFPDMYVFFVIKVKEFLNKCKVLKYTQKIKQLLNKVEEGRKFIETERSKRVFDLKDVKDAAAWEAKIKESGTPVNKFYESWVKVHKIQQLKISAQNDKDDFKVPHLKKSKRKANFDSDDNSDLDIPVEEMERILNKQKKSKKNKSDDSDENSELEVPVEEMEKKLKKNKSKNKKQKKENVGQSEFSNETTDIVKDISIDDW